MISSSKAVLPRVQLSEQAYKIGVPGGGRAGDKYSLEGRLRLQEEQAQARIAALEARLQAETEQARNEGRHEGELRAQARFDEEYKRWAGMLQQLAGARREALHQVESQAVELILRVLDTIIAARPASTEAIGPALRDAFAQLLSKDHLTIVCAPSDAAFMRNLLTEHADEFEDITSYTIREDPAIKTGGCIVETEWGMVDARVEKRLSVLKQIWRDAAKELPPAPLENQ